MSTDSLHEPDPSPRQRGLRRPHPGARRRFTGAAANYIDERTSLSGLVKELGRKIFPDHWSFMLGEIALCSFVVILLSGTFLTFFFQAVDGRGRTTTARIVPLQGRRDVGGAMTRRCDISFDIRGGLLMRQIHHWAALLFVAGIGLHMLRVFFTGAFRKPRELNWVIGFILFILAMAEGFTGYSLPDDLLSGNGLRIIDGMVKGMPVIGTWMSFLLFGGEFPGDADRRSPVLRCTSCCCRRSSSRLLGAAPDAHGRQQAHPVRRPRAARTATSSAYPMMPIYMAKAGGFFFIIFGVIVLIASLFTINPIWNYGPYDPSPVSAGTQPDWYIGFADGALRLIPPGWEFVLLGSHLVVQHPRAARWSCRSSSASS